MHNASIAVSVQAVATHCTAEMEKMMHSRNIFITRQCGDTLIGYAMSRLRHSPRTTSADRGSPGPPCSAAADELETRGIPCRATRAHIDTFRLYRYGPHARRVFQGDAFMCEWIHSLMRQAALRGACRWIQRNGNQPPRSDPSTAEPAYRSRRTFLINIAGTVFPKPLHRVIRRFPLITYRVIL
jgi:hypothetical protein